MQTVEFAGYHLNGGASWIEGYCDGDDKVDHSSCSDYSINPMVPLAQKLNISVSLTPAMFSKRWYGALFHYIFFVVEQLVVNSICYAAQLG